MPGPEGRYIAKIHRQLDKLLSPNGFHFSNTNPFIGGIPDQYYEDDNGCLWIEYKHKSKFPKTIDLTKSKGLSANQLKWLKRSQNNHGNVAVVLGNDDGVGIWFDDLNWEHPHLLQNLKLETAKDIALRIAAHISK